MPWYDMQQACLFEGKQLPTRAEMELAAGGDNCPYPVGEDCVNPFNPINCMLQGNFGFICGSGGLMPVDAMDQIYDGEIFSLGDNAEEWVEDKYYEDFYDVATYKDPVGSVGSDREIFGGSYDSVSDAELTVYNRKHDSPFSAEADRGGRCAWRAE